MALLHRQMGNYREAMAEIQALLRTNREKGSLSGTARTLHELGMLHRAAGRYDAALDAFAEALKTYRTLGNHAAGYAGRRPSHAGKCPSGQRRVRGSAARFRGGLADLPGDR